MKTEVKRYHGKRKNKNEVDLYYLTRKKRVVWRRATYKKVNKDGAQPDQAL